MELTINAFCLLISAIVAIAYLIFLFDRGVLYVLRAGLLIFPLLEFIRRIILIQDLEVHYPFFIILTHIGLRLIGPFFNWHIHLQTGNTIKWIKNPLNILLYGMVLYDIYYAISLAISYNLENIVWTLDQLNGPNVYSSGYAFIQLGYFLHAGWLIKKQPKMNRSLSFMWSVLIVITFALTLQQISYAFLEAYLVDFVVTPVIIASVYVSLIFISVKKSDIKFTTQNDGTSMKYDLLSDREQQVLEKLAEGNTDKEIALQLNLSTGTVNTYCKRIYGKLKVKNRTEAAKFYQELMIMR